MDIKLINKIYMSNYKYANKICRFDQILKLYCSELINLLAIQQIATAITIHNKSLLPENRGRNILFSQKKYSK